MVDLRAAARGAMDGKKHYSYSQCRTFSTCQYRWYLEKIEKLHRLPLYVLESGKAIHAGLETHNLLRKEGKKGLTAEEIVDCAISELESFENWDEMDVKKDDAIDRLYVEGTPPLQHYRNITERKIFDGIDFTSLEAEKEILWEVAGQPFIGFIDLYVPGVVLVDYKLSGRKKSEHQILHDAQLHIYSEIEGVPGAFTQLMRKRNQTFFLPQAQDPKIRRGCLSWLENSVRGMEACRKSGVFTRCQPGEWQCSEKSCPFFRKCYG